VTLQPDCVGRIPAVYADVEERPLQGRVNEGMTMGFSPCGRLGVQQRPRGLRPQYQKPPNAVAVAAGMGGWGTRPKR